MIIFSQLLICCNWNIYGIYLSFKKWRHGPLFRLKEVCQFSQCCVYCLGEVTFSEIFILHSSLVWAIYQYFARFSVRFGYVLAKSILYTKGEIYVVNQMSGSRWYFNYTMWFKNLDFRLRVMSECVFFCFLL